MQIQETLTAFFTAENTRDWETYKTFLHPEITWKLYSAEAKTIPGTEEYLAYITKAYENTAVRFTCNFMEISADNTRVIAYLINDKGERSLDIFDFKDNLIFREFEFLLD